MSIETLRPLFNQAHLSKKNADLFLESSKGQTTSIAKAYHGAAKMICCKFIFNPITNMKLFGEGKTILENEINASPNEPELRFIRYTIQMNTPVFLGYHKQKPEDRKIIIDYLMKHRNDDLCKHMLVFLTDTNDLKGEELNLMN